MQWNNSGVNGDGTEKSGVNELIRKSRGVNGIEREK